MGFTAHNINETKRFEGKVLLPMESHTSADSRSGRIGDIDIIDEKERVFEAVEVKHGIPITAQLVKDAFDKFKTTQVNRYYLLSTANIDTAQADEINKEIDRVNYPFAKDKWASRFTATCLLFRRVRSLTVAPHVYSQVPYEVLMSCTDNTNIQLLI